ncbi:hypothetical protein AXK56_07350 [Tsukamurella pulmonis]|uniref:L-amino acid N-acyltransferase YncA n=2 Tax=Tsukamurella pulmonis TaxID=47312 RepID=A0A1H1CCX7_9ACTN|nr:GNAT family N-acetyltransferase [Tsukamurella pulmonis]KXO89956.1 hypothetical protein AXK56_07350 [Tsukamurella pulmonis]SDQ62051.1 L-amino acid N-acyltransferase YncA [Tsukamurella pulmonis]SUP23865.1 Predicted acetyltransferase [Tsukamurella pulmonis]
MTAAVQQHAADAADADVRVRPLVDDDLAQIAALYAAHPDNPNPIGVPLTADALRAELRDRGTVAFTVAVVDGAVVGTFGLFESTGRRVAEPGQLLADMFFVAPEHRRGSLTGNLFAATVDTMIALGYGVLRLTVNPANAIAYRLYRRVGSLALAPAAAGADGNVELYNVIPLLLSTAAPHLPAAVIEAARSRETFRFGATQGRDAGHHCDVRTAADGTPVVRTTVHLGGAELDAELDADTLTIRSLTLRHDGEETALPVPAAAPRVARAAPTELRRGDWHVRVDDADGAITLRHPGFRGDLLAIAWPAAGGTRPAWRRGRRGDFAVTATAAGLTILDRADPASVVVDLAIADGPDGPVLEHRVTGGPHRRLYLTGLRAGTVRSAAGTARIGTDLAAPGERIVPDTAEIPAAAPAAGDRVTWSGGFRIVAEATGMDARLVDATTLDVRADSGSTVRLRLSAPGPAGAPQVTGGRLRAAGRPLALDPAVGGARTWAPGGRPVLWGPHPRVRALGHLPQWRAGLWVTAEQPDRTAGVGWGAAPGAIWATAGDGLDGDGISWCAVESETEHGPELTVDVDDRGPRAAVLWCTPRTARTGDVLLGDARIPLGASRHRWARPGEEPSIPLPDGGTLTLHAPAGGELLVRATPAGLLIGGLCPPGRSTWRITVRTSRTTTEENR